MASSGGGHPLRGPGRNFRSGVLAIEAVGERSGGADTVEPAQVLARDASPACQGQRSCSKIQPVDQGAETIDIAPAGGRPDRQAERRQETHQRVDICPVDRRPREDTEAAGDRADQGAGAPGYER